MHCHHVIVLPFCEGRFRSFHFKTIKCGQHLNIATLNTADNTVGGEPMCFSTHECSLASPGKVGGETNPPRAPKQHRHKLIIEILLGLASLLSGLASL